MERQIADIRERLATVEQDEKSMHRRLDNLERMVEGIHTLANTCVELAGELKAMRKDVNEIDDRLGVVEETPKKWYETAIKASITAIIGGIAGYFLSKLL